MKIRLILVSVLLSSFYHASCFSVEHTYTVAIVPQYPKLIIHRSWMPLLKYLSTKSGVTLKLKHYQNITQFGSDLYKGSADFAYMNPYHALVARKNQGYIPLIKDSDKKLKGVIVVHDHSPIKSISDLDGKQVAFPSPNAFAASLFTRALLSEKSIKIFPKYVTTHANVYRHVILNKAPAGSGIYRSLNKESAAVKNRLRVIFETPSSAPHPFGAHPRVPIKIRKSIQQAIIELWNDPNNRHLLETVQIAKPVPADYDRDYLPLEKLKLEEFASETEQ